jgi:hypothetical protein
MALKIELINFGGLIVENTHAILVAVLTLFLAKLNLLIVLSAMARYWLLHLYLFGEGGLGQVDVLQRRWYCCGAHVTRAHCCL